MKIVAQISSQISELIFMEVIWIQYSKAQKEKPELNLLQESFKLNTHSEFRISRNTVLPGPAGSI